MPTPTESQLEHPSPNRARSNSVSVFPHNIF
jgi:hypothetical protein